MTLIKKRNGDFPLRSIFSDFFDTDRFFDMDFMRNPFQNVPATNILETEDEFRIELAVPGMTKKDFKIDLDNGLLTISSEKEESHEEKERNYTRKEYNYNAFTRTFTLPNTVKEEDIKAKYENGILRLMVPKKEEVKRKAHKKIDVV